eukprot:3175042-Prymnesium_polylepis.1
MRATGDGGEVSAATEKQRRMLPWCRVCSPLQPHPCSLTHHTSVVSCGARMGRCVRFVGQGPLAFSLQGAPSRSACRIVGVCVSLRAGCISRQLHVLTLFGSPSEHGACE